MLRRRSLLLGSAMWQPPASKHIDQHMKETQLQPQPERKHARSALSEMKGHMPLTLKARVHLAERSDEKTHHVVDVQCFGQRLDEFVLKSYPEMTYEGMKKLVEGGHIYRYSKTGKKKYTRVYDRLELDELVVVPTTAMWKNQVAPPSGIVEPSPEEKEAILQRQNRVISSKAREEALSWVLFKNEHVVVLNKPSGVPMEPAADPSARLNISALLPVWRFTNQHSPVVCNKLDRETSGIVVLARDKEAHRMLARMFMRRVTPNNVYWSFLVGKPTATYGRIRMHCEVQRGSGGNIIVARPTPTEKSKVAIAEYVVNASALEYGSFVSFYPLTNRTHQLRIMSAHALRCPVFGDGKFGGDSAFPQSLKTFWDPQDRGLRLHLHHRKIQLPYKRKDGSFICVTAPLPSHMKDTFAKLGWPSEVDDPLIPG